MAPTWLMSEAVKYEKVAKVCTWECSCWKLNPHVPLHMIHPPHCDKYDNMTYINSSLWWRLSRWHVIRAAVHTTQTTVYGQCAGWFVFINKSVMIVWWLAAWCLLGALVQVVPVLLSKDFMLQHFPLHYFAQVPEISEFFLENVYTYTCKIAFFLKPDLPSPNCKSILYYMTWPPPCQCTTYELWWFSQHMTCDDSLKYKKKDYHNCFQFLVLYTVYSSGLAVLYLSHCK